MQFLIQNAGQGVALIAHCAFLASGRFMYSLVGEGVISPGERWRLETSIPSTDPTAAGVVWCENADGEFFAWSLDDESKHFRKRPDESPEQTLGRFYPGIQVDLDTAVLPGHGMGFRQVTS